MSKSIDGPAFNSLVSAYNAANEGTAMPNSMQYNPTVTGSVTGQTPWYYNGYSYPVYQYLTPDKTQTAFKLAKKLMDKGFIEVDSVKDFITLIDTLVGAL